MPAGVNNTVPQSRIELAQRVDDTRLVFQPTEDQDIVIRFLCHDALNESFRAVCVRPWHVANVKSFFDAKSQPVPVKIATVIGFPMDKIVLDEERKMLTVGAVPLEYKLAEIQNVLADGAQELDVVMHVDWFKKNAASLSPQQLAEHELNAIMKAANKACVKLIIETDLLTPTEITKATQMAVSAGVHFVKTSTGMLAGGQGATVENIALIRKTIEEMGASDKTQIKASGGIRNWEQAQDLFKAGANILGCGNGLALLDTSFSLFG